MTRPRRRAALIVWGALLAVWCVSTWKLSSQSDPESYVGFRVELPDKLEHGIEYAVGGVLAAGVVSSFGARRVLIGAIVFAGLWGTLDEVHQSWVPGRDSSGMDLAADVIGATIGALVFACGPGRAKKARREVDELDETTKEPTRT